VGIHHDKTYIFTQDDPVCVAARAQGHKVVSELWVDDNLDRAVLADADRVCSFPPLIASALLQSFFVYHIAAIFLRCCCSWCAICVYGRSSVTRLVSSTGIFCRQVIYWSTRDLKGIPGSDQLRICLTGYQRNDREDIMVKSV
jgi:hypothetical protein